MHRQGMKALLVCGLLLALTHAAVPLGSHADEQTARVIDEFRQHIEQLPGIAQEKKDAAIQVLESLASDPDAQSYTVPETLLVLYPEFAAAMDLAGNESFAEAYAALAGLSSSSDPYLGASATYLHGRTLVMEEKFEEALPLWQDLLENRSSHSTQLAEVLYFRGMSEAAALKNPEAIASLSEFLQRYPDAPERMRVSAWRKLQELHSLEAGSMDDVHQRMQFSRRQLQLEKTGERTQEEQEKIIGMLAKLIEQVEQQEAQGSGTNEPSEEEGEGEGQPSDSQDGQGQSQNGGGSRNPNGVVKRTFDDGPASEWSNLRDRSRDPAFSVIKEKYPAKIEQLFKQYSKSFQKESGPDKD